MYCSARGSDSKWQQGRRAGLGWGGLGWRATTVMHTAGWKLPVSNMHTAGRHSAVPTWQVELQAQTSTGSLKTGDWQASGQTAGKPTEERA